MDGERTARCRVVAVVGSLRRESLNRRLAETMARHAPDGIGVEVRVADLPLFNADLEAGGDPPAVAALKAAVEGSDAVALVGPEYNGSCSGVTKNALDWLSRPPGRSCLVGKPVGLAAASAGSGGGHALAAARQILPLIGAHVMPWPFLVVRRAGDVLGADTDPPPELIGQIRWFLGSLADLGRRLGPGLPGDG